MKRSKTRLFVILAIAGLCCEVAGLYFADIVNKTASGLLLGMGAGLFGMSIAQIVMSRLERKNPQFMHQAEINQKDERLEFIRNKSRAQAGNITQWLIIALAYIMIIIDAPLWAILSAVGIFLAHTFLSLWFMAKYEKEM